MKNEIIIYRPNELAEHIEVKIDEETVWLNRKEIATLFDRDVKTVGKHINNAIREELSEFSVVAKFATVQKEGTRYVERLVEYYNLDVILSVGYRVKSNRGIQFRIWANRVLKEYLFKGYSINNRLNRLEDNLDTLKSEVKEINLQINSHLIPTQGIFFEGQVYDAYEFVSKIIRSAKHSIVLIDNYVDETVITHLTKKDKCVTVEILTHTINSQLILDITKANKQYGGFSVNSFNDCHDRFLIIDDEVIYHLGASLKDLGKKWFAFTKMDKSSVKTILNKIKI
jgi:hypothetical protein